MISSGQSIAKKTTKKTIVNVDKISNICPIKIVICHFPAIYFKPKTTQTTR